MIEEILEAYASGLDEEVILRIFDLTYPELCAILMTY